MVAFHVDSLLLEANHLEEFLTQRIAGQETEWVDHFAQALIHVEDALSEHRPLTERRMLACVNPFDRGPNASFSRHVEALQKNLEILQGRVTCLLDNVQTAFLTPERMDRLHDEAETVVQSIRKIQKDENNLLMEIALRDTGAGD